MTPVAEDAGVYRTSFERFERDHAGAAWLRPVRRAAIARFEERGFPTTRDEEWRYTNVAPIARTPFRPAGDGAASSVTAESLAPVSFGADGARAVFVNGRHARQLSSAGAGQWLPGGVEILSLRDVLEREPERLESHLTRLTGAAASTFAWLNTAFLEDGAFVGLSPGTVVAEPIHIVFFSTGGAAGERTVSHPRTLIVAGLGSQATIVESYLGAEGQVYLTNAVTEIRVGDGAGIDHYKLQRESTAAFHVATLSVRQGRSSRFSDHSIALGGALVRNDIDALFAAEGSECVLNGLFVADGQQHTDTHTRIDHATPHCSSRELYKGIVDGRARGVFDGKIVVRAGAQKTDALQTNKNLLLSREALVHSKPAFEILADDVKCKHGSTTGQLDEGALFYLRSRGIGEEAARSLLTYAFASDVVGRIRVPALRAGLEAVLHDRLPNAPEEDVA